MRCFFSVDSTKARLDREYEKFTKAIVSIHSDTAEYSYIKSRHFVDEQLGQNGVVEDIMQQINDSQPYFISYRSCCGILEKLARLLNLLKGIITKGKGQVPLFSELSRNRQAKIFHYVLLDEIDRSFPGPQF